MVSSFFQRHPQLCIVSVFPAFGLVRCEFPLHPRHAEGRAQEGGRDGWDGWDGRHGRHGRGQRRFDRSNGCNGCNGWQLGLRSWQGWCSTCSTCSTCTRAHGLQNDGFLLKLTRIGSNRMRGAVHANHYAHANA